VPAARSSFLTTARTSTAASPAARRARSPSGWRTPLGTVSSLDGGQILQTITAPADGVPMFITSSPAVAANGLLLGLGVT
jgi:hypothetical protein